MVFRIPKHDKGMSYHFIIKGMLLLCAQEHGCVKRANKKICRMLLSLDIQQPSWWMRFGHFRDTPNRKMPSVERRGALLLVRFGLLAMALPRQSLRTHDKRGLSVV